MTVEELMELLQDMPPEAEVRFASQPSWPLDYQINNVITVETEDDVTVFLAQGEQVGYLCGDAVMQLGWR
jgi:hypothetical protein